MIYFSGATSGGIMIFGNHLCEDTLERFMEHLHHLLTAKVGAPESKHSREFGGLLPRSEYSLPQGATE